MKKNKVNEENMFQKYDDLFAEQDSKYDTNNSNRYAKKKSVRSEDVEYQRYDRKKDVPNENYRSLMILGIVTFFIFGFIVLMTTNFALIREVNPIVIIGVIAVVSSFFRKNKRK